MSFGPLTGKARVRRIHVYDGEWIPGNPEKAKAHGFEPLTLRLFGHFDGVRYRHYTRVPDFLNAVCTRENTGAWFYAHAGGLADLVFVLQYLVDNPRPGIQISCHFSGSSAIIVKIERGRDHWFFVDSYWLLRQPLREIAKWVGMEKGGAKESTDTFYAPLPELIAYNELDCRILHKAISTFQFKILELGGELQKTIASTALCLFRRRFLKRKILTDEKVNEWARLAYYASRVEVHERYCREADYWDVNSSFPFAMTFPAPGNVLRMGKGLRENELGLQRATVRVPDSDDIPPAPYRGKDKRIYFPSGQWNGWFSHIDLQWLEERGGKIVRTYECVSFEPIDDLKGYAQTIYEWRRSTDDPALKIVLKFLLNSLYGKFGEGRQKQRVVIHPGRDFFDIPERSPGGLGREMLMPGVHALVEDREIPHAHVPISVHITAIARRVLAEYLVKVPTLYYCDTDGFGAKGAEFEQSDALGALKREKHIFEADFAAPKLYAYRESSDGKWNIRSKGFNRVIDVGDDGARSESRKINYQDFQSILQHKDIYLENFGRLRSLWREGITTPRDSVKEKTYRGTARPKRAPDGEHGATRPWSVSELREAS